MLEALFELLSQSADEESMKDVFGSAEIELGISEDVQIFDFSFGARHNDVDDIKTICTQTLLF